jgi:hypothetical protein
VWRGSRPHGMLRMFSSIWSFASHATDHCSLRWSAAYTAKAASTQCWRVEDGSVSALSRFPIYDTTEFRIGQNFCQPFGRLPEKRTWVAGIRRELMALHGFRNDIVVAISTTRDFDETRMLEWALSLGPINNRCCFVMISARPG